MKKLIKESAIKPVDTATSLTCEFSKVFGDAISRKMTLVDQVYEKDSYDAEENAVSEEKIVTTETSKLYKVVKADDEEVVGSGKLKIEINEELIRVDMFDESKKLDTSVRHFVKAYNQAYKDGVVDVDMFGNDSWTAEDMCWGVDKNNAGKVAFVMNYEEGEFENYIYLNINRHNMAHYDEVTATESILEDAYEVYGGEDKDVCDMDSALEDAYFDEVDFIAQKVKQVLSGESIYSAEIENAVSAEVQEEEKIITTADLEAQLETMKAQIEDSNTEIDDKFYRIKYYQKHIIEYITNIMKAEDLITKFGVEMMSEKAKIAGLNEQAAALEAEIFNRKIVDAYTESLVTAEAFNASVQAEENAAIMSMAVTPLTFDAQRFDEEEKEMLIAENDTIKA